MRRAAVAGAVALALLVAAAFAARGCAEPLPRPPARPVVRAESPPPEPELPLPPPPAPEPPSAPPPPPPPRPPPAPVVPAAAPAVKMGSIIGTVKLFGPAPAIRRPRMDADPRCVARNESPPPSDELVVDREARVRWAFVYVKSGLNDRRFPPPTTPVLLDQVGCRYRPHVLGIQVGQPLIVRNGDPLLHNVHVLPLRNRERNFGQPEFEGRDSLHFTAPEVMVPIRCDIHPWMSAWAGVLDHPFFAVTDELGGYAITGLPPGRYELEVWHERLAGERREVDVDEDEQVTADFLLRMKSESR